MVSAIIEAMTTLYLNAGDSINEALSSAEEGPLTIILGEGVWKEKVTVTRPDVTLISECGSVISWGDRHGAESDGKVMNTGESATFTVAAPSFTAIGVTFENSFDYPRAFKYNEENEDGVKLDLQAVALRTVFGADKSIFRSCTFLGWQDTLYLDSGVASIEDSTVEGCVDFIFGSSPALFQGCDIISRAKGVIAAPSTYEGEEIGFIFHDCTFRHESCVVDESVALARPWFPSGSENRSPMVLLIDCTLESHIKSELWADMGTKKPQDKEKTIHKGSDARFFISSQEREDITGEEADRYLSLIYSRL